MAMVVSNWQSHPGSRTHLGDEIRVVHSISPPDVLDQRPDCTHVTSIEKQVTIDTDCETPGSITKENISGGILAEGYSVTNFQSKSSSPQLSLNKKPHIECVVSSLLHAIGIVRYRVSFEVSLISNKKIRIKTLVVH